MKTLRLLPVAAALLLLATTTACSRRNYARTDMANPQEAPYSTTRSRATPANTGDNTAGHQNRVIRANTDR